MKEATNYLNNLLNKDDTVILGCSGGPDSMCLLSLLENIKNIKIVVAHVNHKVRPESDSEYNILKNYCENNNIIFEGMEIEKISGNFEGEARKIRYSFYESLLNKYNAKYIMTAHHGDDLIETILMRLTRGSTLSGYIGLKLLDGHYVRPLLFTTKDEILDYVNSNNISYFWDYTNDLDEHTRNRYRHKVLPFLKKENPKVHQKYLKFSNELIEYDNFVNDYIDKSDIIDNNKIYIPNFLKENDFIQRKIIERIIKNLQKNYLFNISDKNVHDIIKLAHSLKSNASINLPNGFRATKEYNFLVVDNENIFENYHIIFNERFENDDWIIYKLTDSEDSSNDVIRLLSSEIQLPLFVKCREEKDKMHLNGGTRKIKDIYIDAKISINERKKRPIVCDSENNILWLPGLKKSKFAKDKNEKYDIILKCERKKNNE